MTMKKAMLHSASPQMLNAVQQHSSGNMPKSIYLKASAQFREVTDWPMPVQHWLHAVLIQAKKQLMSGDNRAQQPEHK